MTQYIRFQKQLTKLIKQVFSVSGISIDTKLIVLVLAATMPRSKFGRWIDVIPSLQPISAQFKQINAIRQHFGVDCRNYLMLVACKHALHPVTDTELQQFISWQQNNVACSIHSELTCNESVSMPALLFRQKA